MAKNGSGERTPHVCEVEFSIRGSRYPFVNASKTEACTIALAEMFPRPDGRYAEFFNVRGADPERLVSSADAYGSVDVTLLAEYENGGFLEFLVSDDCPAFRLAELGALPREVRGEGGTGRIVAEIPPQRNASAIVAAFLDDHPDTELVTKRGKNAIAPRFSGSAFRQVLHSHLTDRQREVLRTAFEEGYYNWSRGCTGTDVADELDITSATFSEHIKAAERNLLTVLFEDSDSDRS